MKTLIYLILCIGLFSCSSSADKKYRNTIKNDGIIINQPAGNVIITINKDSSSIVTK